jgi:hypothetical protein
MSKGIKYRIEVKGTSVSIQIHHLPERKPTNGMTTRDMRVYQQIESEQPILYRDRIALPRNVNPYLMSADIHLDTPSEAKEYAKAADTALKAWFAYNYK